MRHRLNLLWQTLFPRRAWRRMPSREIPFRVPTAIEIQVMRKPL